jgi:hypothetical protein
MENQTGFVLKVFLLSAVLSAMIKYVGPYLNIPAESQIVLIIVLLPSLVLAIALWWRNQQQQNSISK